MGFDFKCSCLPHHLVPSPLPLDVGYLFFGGFQHYPVDDCSAGNGNFGVLAGECVPCKWLIYSLYYVFVSMDFFVLVLEFLFFFFVDCTI